MLETSGFLITNCATKPYLKKSKRKHGRGTQTFIVTYRMESNTQKFYYTVKDTLFLTKGQKQTLENYTTSLNITVKNLDILMRFNPYLQSCTKIISKWTKDINVNL